MAATPQGRVTKRNGTIRLRAPGLDSTVRIAPGVSSTLPDALHGRPALVIVDTAVWRRHRPALAPLLDGALGRLILPGGEAVKTPDRLAQVWRRCAAAGLPRNGLIVGIGGGTILDLAGFAAATWMRGVSFVSVPTTLLAAADASVGGKTAVDLDGLKNPVGAFHAAETVLIDPDLLATLPRREWRCGLAEVVKMAVISEPKLFATLEAAAPELHALLARGPAARRVDGIAALPWSDWLLATVAAKAKVVAADYREAGARKALNLGHTLAHALEPLLDIPHGHAVALGLSAVVRTAAARGDCSDKTRDRILALLNACGLPTTCQAPPLRSVAPYILRDKKTTTQTNWVVPTAIGQVTLDQNLPLSEVLDMLAP